MSGSCSKLHFEVSRTRHASETCRFWLSTGYQVLNLCQSQVGNPQLLLQFQQHLLVAAGDSLFVRRLELLDRLI